MWATNRKRAIYYTSVRIAESTKRVSLSGGVGVSACVAPWTVCDRVVPRTCSLPADTNP